jgi:putative DNA primase/helicase
VKSLNIPLEEFLRPFFDPGELVCLRVFDDRKTGAFKGAKLECEAGKIAAMEDTLRKHNAQNRGIYFVINYGGHEDTDITRISAQFVECDSLSMEEQLAQIKAFAVEPSLIVRTRKSLHTYWLMKDAKVEDFRRVQKRLIAQFQGDRTIINESRVLRLPGFNHCKGEPYPVECIKFNPELRYTQAELEANLPEVEDEPEVKGPTPQGTRKGLALVGKRCLFIQHCKENVKSLSEHDWYAMITNLAVFEGGEDVIHTLSRPYPGYKRAETQEKINHFLESGTKPITCATIASKGFTCPHLEDGECKCKAPAALCYQPLTVEELRAMLTEQPVAETQVENMQAAQIFVRDYLYNIDPALAATFINYEVSAHFGMKAPDMRPLIGQQKQAHKAHIDNKDTRRELAGGPIPDWYEPTERGLRFVPGLLANHMKNTVDAFYGAGSYFFYEGGVYAMSSDLAASAKVREFLIPRYATMHAINDALGQWRMEIEKPLHEINANPFIINVKNGLYNVLDGSFKAHSPDYCSTVQINARYDESAECPQFLAFLKGILPDTEHDLVQEIFGYLLIPINKAQKSFVFTGASNAGKSTLLSVAQDILLGRENVSNIPWQSLSDRFKTAELFGKLANIFADLPSKSVDDNGMFKALTGEDYITAERKNKDPFAFRPYARMVFSCNEMPRNYGDRSDGFFRRLVIIRFDRSIPESERDPDLREKLAVERDGIFLWALAGLRRLMAGSYIFTETQRTADELQRYRIESNSALSFVDECCLLTEGAECMREDLFQAYREYCHKNGFKAMSQANFNKEIENGFERVTRSLERVSRRKTWKGIRLDV